MIFRMVCKSGQIFLPFCHNTRVWQTDGRTEFSSLDCVCIPCSAVKMQLSLRFTMRLQKVRMHTGGLAVNICLSVSLSVRQLNACIVTKRNNLPPKFL